MNIQIPARYVLILLTYLMVLPLYNQSSPLPNALNQNNAIDTVNKKRLNLLVGSAAAIYTSGSIALYHAWYRDYDQDSFHFFNDSGEWLQMDKMGHVYSAYQQTRLSYAGLRWTGLSSDKSLLYASISSGVAQTTIEVMDGFSSEWGFSWYDFGANIVGIGGFAFQQKCWQEQRILMKYSSRIKSYDDVRQGETVISIEDRADALFGRSWPERLLKDYNAQTIWLSANVKSFMPKYSVPDWLNVAVGFGVEQVYGGYQNRWEQAGQNIDLTENLQRYYQLYISLDMDLSKIETDSKFLRTTLEILNAIKVPFGAIEVNTLGQVKLHLIHF